jgi:hypothetical protein
MGAAGSGLEVLVRLLVDKGGDDTSETEVGSEVRGSARGIGGVVMRGGYGFVVREHQGRCIPVDECSKHSHLRSLRLSGLDDASSHEKVGKRGETGGMGECESTSSMGDNVSACEVPGRMGSATALSIDWAVEGCGLRSLRAGSNE